MTGTELAFGVDIGGTNTVYGAVDRSGKVLVKGSMPTPRDGNVAAYMDHIAQALKQLVAELPGNPQVCGIGIGAPNGNYFSGTIESAPNLNLPPLVPVVSMMQERYPCGIIRLTNDANAAAMGEMMYGGAKGMRDFMVVTLGTGLGSGIVSGGSMVYGHDGFAGELGHVTVKRGGRECGCGRQGCLETYASATGLCRTAQELLAHMNAPSRLRNLSSSDISARILHDFALDGDAVALETFRLTGEILGWALADAIALFSPQAIFLFGGLANAGEMLFKPTREAMIANTMHIFQNKTRLLPSGIPEGDAAILGASALVWDAG